MSTTETKQHPEVIQKVLNKEELSSRELALVAYEYDEYHFEVIEGEDRRWVRGMTTVLKIDDRYFVIDYDQGLTEYQEDQFYDQPYEVTVEQKERTIIENFYKRV